MPDEAKTSTDKSRIKFLLLEGIHPAAIKMHQAVGYTQIESLPGALRDDELKLNIADAHSDIALAKLVRVPGTLSCRDLF